MLYIGFCGDWNPCCLSLCLNSCLTDTVVHIYRPHSWWLFCPLHRAEALQSPGRKIAAGEEFGVSSEVKERFLSSCKGPPAITIFLSYSLNQKRNLCFFSGSRDVEFHPVHQQSIRFIFYYNHVRNSDLMYKLSFLTNDLSNAIMRDNMLQWTFSKPAYR